MSHGLSESPSNALFPNHDFPNVDTVYDRASGLASALQEAAQILLSYSQNCESVPKKPVPKEYLEEQAQVKQAFDTQKPSASMQSRSKRTKRKEKCQACAFNRHAPDAFADFAGKELAKSFEEAYSKGNFRDEIRYYYVPSYLVKYEYRLLHLHQQNTILDMLLGVHTELDIRSKLLAYIADDICEQDLLLRQVSESLLQPLRLLQTIHSHLSNFTLIHKAMLPHTHKR